MEAPSNFTSPTVSNGNPESKAQEQARLRRERRNAKIVAGGSARLDKITSLNGGLAPIEPDEVTNQKAQAAHTNPALRKPLSSRPINNATSPDDDPAEVDISQMFRHPPSDPTTPQSQDDLIRQMLRSGGPNMPAQDPGAEDPIMSMMQQLLGGFGGPGGPGGAGDGGLPAGLASIFGGGVQQPQPISARNSEYLWRIVHALTFFLIAVYTVSSFAFTGSSLARNISVDSLSGGMGTRLAAPRLFWMFATAELVLQSGRYFLNQGRLPPSGWLGTLGNMLPMPYANYVRIANRYSVIYTTVLSDAMVIIFVLGCLAWWNGMAAS